MPKRCSCGRGLRVPVWALVVVAVGMTCSPAPRARADEPPPATCITLRRGHGGTVAGAHLAHEYPTWTTGGESSMWTGKSSTGGLNHALVRFDLSPIPQSAVVSSAALTLSVSWNQNGGHFGVHRITAPWSEATVKKSLFTSGDPWLKETAALLPIPPMGATSTNLTPLVADRVHGVVPNHGVVISGWSTKNNILWSSEASTVGARKALRVCRSLPPDPPAPSQGSTGDGAGGTCAPTCLTLRRGIFGDFEDAFLDERHLEARRSSSSAGGETTCSL